MRHTDWWLQGLRICGFDETGGDGATGAPPAGSPPAGAQGAPPEGAAGGETGDGDDGGEGQTPEDLTGLKSALAAERAANKQNKADQKELKRLRDLAEANDLKDKSELEKAQAAEKKSADRTAKLAAGLKTTKLDIALESEARALKFINPSIALQLVARDAIGVEQDEDDPSSITINMTELKRAVKKVADDNKYLIDAGGEGDPSGSRFGGGNKGGDKDKLNAEELKKKYPSLQ